MGTPKLHAESITARVAAASRADPDEARRVLVKPAKVEKNDEDSAYDRAREKVEAIKREREEVVLRDFDGARYLR